MAWLIFAFAAPVLWAISTHIDKYLVDRFFHRGSVAALLALTGIMGMALAPTIWLLVPGSLFLPLRSVALIVASGALSMAALYLYLAALQDEEASAVVPWFQLAPLFGFALAYLFLGETLTSRQLVGGVAVLVGAIVLSVNAGAGSRFKARLAILMLAAAFMVAVSTVMFKFFAIQDEFWSTTAWTGVGQALCGLLLLLRAATWTQLVAMFRGSPGTFLTVNSVNEVVNLAGLLAQRYALTLAPVSLVQAIGGTAPLFVFAIGVGLSWIWPSWGRENLSPVNLAQKAIAAVLVVVGISLIQ